MNARTSQNETKNVLARLVIGVEAVDDNIGSIIVAAPEVGKAEVFIYCGTLPNGENCRTFEGPECVALAFEFAMKTARDLIDQELSDMDLDV